MYDKKKIAISGAGIGGLTLAIALQRSGIDFSIYDQATSFESVGYGIQVTPNAVSVLQALGLEKELADISHHCHAIDIRDLASDRSLLRWQIKTDTPYYQCLRSDLHDMLYKQCSLGQAINYNRHITSPADIKEDYLIAADGVHSSIRQYLFPGQQAQFSGYIAYRAIIPFDTRFAELKNTTTVWLSENQHIVVYPVGADNVINIALVAKQKDMRSDGWVHPVSNDEVVTRFKSQVGVINDLLSHLQQQQTQSYCWGLFDYPPLPYWHNGKLVLLGDAAHPMLPFMAQGAAMAIEDGWALAQCIKQENSFVKACQRYQTIRYQRASKVQKISRKNAAAFHAGGLIKYGRNRLFTLISMLNPQLMQLKTHFLYQYDITKEV